MAKDKSKQLEEIREKVSALLDQETKIRQDLVKEFSDFLIKANALSIDFDTLLGGVLGVIDVAQSTTKSIKEDEEKKKIKEEWKKSGQKFRRNLDKSNTKKQRTKEPEKNQIFAKEAA